MGIRQLLTRQSMKNSSFNNAPSIANPTRPANQPLSNVGSTNPIDYAIDEVYGETGDMSHTYPFVNQFKVLEIMRVRPDQEYPAHPSHTEWGNWRTVNVPRTQRDGSHSLHVSNSVFLFPDNNIFNFAYTNDYGKAWESLSGGAVGKVMQLGEMLRVASAMAGNPIEMGGKFVSKFKQAPTWNGTLPLELASSLKFNFKFGQAGLFNAEQEVVRPILALAAMFLPIKAAASGPMSRYFVGPVPTPPQYLANFMTRFFSGKTLTDIGSSFTNLENVRNAEDAGPGGMNAGSNLIDEAASAVTALENALMLAKDEAVQNTLAAHHGGALAIRMGRMTFGPFLIKNVAWDFDFTQVDEYGFPYRGSLSYSGLESIIMPSIGQLTGTMQRNLSQDRINRMDDAERSKHNLN